MTTAEKVQQARSPQEAMLAVAQALDEIIALVTNQSRTTEDWFTESWSKPAVPLPPPAPASGPPVVITGEDSTTVLFQPPSEEKQNWRRQFAEQTLHIADYVGDHTTDWADVYAKGGPSWLYIGNRELVMSLPYQVRQVLVADLEEDAPEQAREMARDILKQPADATGFGNSPALADEFEGGVRR